MAEANFARQDVPETGIGSGLSDFELGLRLRYEIVKEFAPYVGVDWARQVGDTARFARTAGEDAASVSLVLGVRLGFSFCGVAIVWGKRCETSLSTPPTQDNPNNQED